MAGKWAKFQGKLAKFEIDPKWQAKVDEAKVIILGVARGENANVAYLARKFAEIKRAVHKLEDKLSDYNTQLEALSQLLVDRLEGEEQQSVELRGGITVSLKTDAIPSVKDRKMLFEWIKKTRQLQLLSVHHQTLKALTKSLLEQGHPPVPGTEVFLKVSATCRGLNVKEKDKQEAA